MEYKFDCGACIPVRVHTVVMSSQHKQFDNDVDQVRKDLKEKVIEKVIPESLLDDKTLFYLNPCGINSINKDDKKIRPNLLGSFHIGGPHSDAGIF